MLALQPPQVLDDLHKLQYYDPFLYLFQEFRKWSLQAKLIVCIGYGFFDEHVNSILGQALNSDPDMKLLWVAPVLADPDKKEEAIKSDVEKIEKSLRLNVTGGTKVVRWDTTAPDFMTKLLKIDELTKIFPQEEELLPEVKLDSTDECPSCHAPLVNMGNYDNAEAHTIVTYKQYGCGYAEGDTITPCPNAGVPSAAAQPAQNSP